MSESKYKIVGMMAIADCPITIASVIKLSKLVDYLILRYDIVQGNRRDGAGGRLYSALFRRLDLFNVPVCHFDATTGYKGGKFWREEMLEKAHELEPELVFLFDSDEIMEDENGFWQDVEKFRGSQCDVLMFRNIMATSDGRNVPHAAKAPHCKVFKWMPGISFFRQTQSYVGGGGCGVPCFPKAKYRMQIAETNIMHYSMFTPEMESDKLKWYLSFKSEKNIRTMFKQGGLDTFDQWRAAYE